MKIWITTNAIAGPKDTLLWSSALYGLKRLEEMNHELAYKKEKLSSSQLQLLTNDQITTGDFSAEDADIQISAEGNNLVALNSEEEVIAKANNWTDLSNNICFPTRKATQTRTTAETDITISLNLDGSGQSNIDTGLGFFDHMLEQISKHGLMDLDITCDGDLHIDEHHTIEDVAITLGKAIKKALGNKIGIERYGFTLPMDESVAKVAIDLSGRPYLVFEGNFNREYVGDFPTEMVEHFFYSLAINADATLRISVEGDNDHHKIEACFKGLARCLRAAVSRSERNKNVLPSTKDLL